MREKFLTPIFFMLILIAGQSFADENKSKPEQMEFIEISKDGQGFVYSESQKKYSPWGFNYIGDFGRIAEDYWKEDWKRIEKDFSEMKKLNANVVRLHLQLGTYLKSPDEVDQTEIALLKKTLDLAQEKGLYLKLTGLCCFRLKDVPKWLDPLPEKERWNVQAKFWETIAIACADHPAVFSYDLMNEPVIGKHKKGEHPWLLGKLDEFYFVQRICNQPQKRNHRKIASTWIKKMISAIRKHDKRHLITIGVIPFALSFPKAKPMFYSPEALKQLDFISVHFYPRKGEVDKAITALKVYDLGKPVVIGEIFPLQCTLNEMDDFINRSQKTVDGWIGHYFGRSIQEHQAGKEPAGKLSASFLEYWQKKGLSFK